MSILGLSNAKLNELGAYYTGNEIWGQPLLWKDLLHITNEIYDSLKKFISDTCSHKDINIILTGAGTSSFIGDVLEGPLQSSTGIPTKSIATTDLVTHPEIYFNKNKKYLLISFARSGDSPESSKVIELAELISKKVFHLVITCNKDGRLINEVMNKEHFIYFMPPQANDKSLAMTGSFTTMLLAGLIISRISQPDIIEKQVEIIHTYGSLILDEYVEKLKKIAELNFERAVFLGSGIFRGIAEESHLKLQELTDGKIICKYDTFLGFRHGPKAVVDERTILLYLFSNDDYVNNYEIDLVNALKKGRKNLCSVGIMEKDLGVDIDQKIILSNNGVKAEEEFLTIVSVLPAQILAFFKSIQLGLKPDTPSDSGMIHRVVQGVKIYPYKNNNI
ncbi:MAG: SIS domain-containing protein [Ignavibacteria bacterium]